MFKNPPSIVILYSDAKREYFPTEQMYIAEAEVKNRAEVVSKYLIKMGIKVTLLAGDNQVSRNLEKIKPDMIINLVDSVRGIEELCCAVPGILEVINIPYTGTGILGLSLSTNKFLTKKLLEQSGVPVPRYQLFSSPTQALGKLRFPVISKLNSVHGSVDINKDAISEDEKSLRKRLRYLIKTYEDDVLVEQFIQGREFSAILIEGVKKKIYIGEKIYEGSWKNEKYKLATFDAVWGGGDSFHYKKFRPDAKLQKYIRAAYDALKIEDYAKFDVMRTKNGRYYFIDSNPNTALGPHKDLQCEIGTILELHGIPFSEVLRRLIKNCMQYYKRTTANPHSQILVH